MEDNVRYRDVPGGPDRTQLTTSRPSLAAMKIDDGTCMHVYLS